MIRKLTNYLTNHIFIDDEDVDEIITTAIASRYGMVYWLSFCFVQCRCYHTLLNLVICNKMIK